MMERVIMEWPTFAWTGIVVVAALFFIANQVHAIGYRNRILRLAAWKEKYRVRARHESLLVALYAGTCHLESQIFWLAGNMKDSLAFKWEPKSRGIELGVDILSDHIKSIGKLKDRNVAAQIVQFHFSLAELNKLATEFEVGQERSRVKEFNFICVLAHCFEKAIQLRAVLEVATRHLYDDDLWIHEFGQKNSSLFRWDREDRIELLDRLNELNSGLLAEHWAEDSHDLQSREPKDSIAQPGLPADA